MNAKGAIANVSDASDLSVRKDTCRVDLWAALAESDVTRLHGSELLDDEDRRWSARLRQPAARRQFLAGHIMLRVALSEAVLGSVLPSDWHFERDDQGKLSLAPGFPEIHFGLSHEQRLVVAAVCETNPVGIDVVRLAERPSEPPVWSAAAPSERAQLLTESPECRAHDFARLWALKEAYTKVLGVGHGVDFSLIEGDLPQRHLRQAERECKVAFETHTLWCSNDHYFVALAVGTERATRIDSRGHLLDLTGGSWFRQSEISPHEAVWPKRWKWHWL
jgi:phosphopantetheinyl transferase